MNRAKVWNILYAVLWFLQMAVEAMTLFTIWRLNMLPDQYMLMLVAVFLLLWSLTGLMLLIPPKKMKGGKIRRGIACVLVLVISVVCAAVVTVVSDVHETLNSVTNDDPNENENKLTRAVYVRADDPAQSLEDAVGYTFGIVDGYDAANMQQVLTVISQTLGEDARTVSFASIPEMVDGLYDGTVDAIIVNDANIAILEEEADYADFHDKARLLCNIEIQAQSTQSTEPGPTESGDPDPTQEVTEPILTAPSIAEPQDITNTPFLVYIAGSDTRSSKLSNSRNDVNILAVVNPETKQILLINTPRDYYVGNPAGNGALDKLTHCGNYGVANSAQALATLYGDRIDYYAQINFKGFETFIDAIGGITVNSSVAFSTSSGHTFVKGENYLDGEAALAFARERYALAGGDSARGENQMKVVKAVIKKLTSGTTIISKYAEILNSLSGMFRTNLSMDELSALVKMQLSDMASWDILTYSVSGTGAYRVTYSAPGMELYVMLPDSEDVSRATELIDRVIAGEILTEADVS